MSLQRVGSKAFPVVFTPEIRQEDSCSFPYLVCFVLALVLRIKTEELKTWAGPLNTGY